MLAITLTMSSTTGIRWRASWIFSMKLSCLSDFGTLSGFSSAHTMIQPLNSTASIRPGSTPAMNSLEIDSSADTPYTIRMIEGGISSPRVAGPPSEPMICASV